jgi:hypothetical protein
LDVSRRPNERVHYADRTAKGLAPCDDLTPGVRDFGRDRQDTLAKSCRKFMPQPGIQALAPASCGQAIDAAPQFRKCHDADE